MQPRQQRSGKEYSAQKGSFPPAASGGHTFLKRSPAAYCHGKNYIILAIIRRKKLSPAPAGESFFRTFPESPQATRV